MRFKVLRARTILASAGLVIILIAGCGSRKKAEKTPSADLTWQEASPHADAGAIPTSETIQAYELSDIHFDFDRYNLRSGDREILTNHGKWLSENSRPRILIEGHCDERGTVEYNLALGERRARTARDFLIAYGISQDRIDVISYGKERPQEPGHDERAWAANRRAHFVTR